MEKASQKSRDIKFFSEKNKAMVCVHSKEARNYAKYLEDQPWVESYETDIPLELARFPHISSVDIRPEYFTLAWVSDFCLHYADGRTGIREMISERHFEKRASIERLELSRRYWKAMDVPDWKLVIIEDKTEEEKS